MGVGCGFVFCFYCSCLLGNDTSGLLWGPHTGPCCVQLLQGRFPSFLFRCAVQQLSPVAPVLVLAWRAVRASRYGNGQGERYRCTGAGYGVRYRVQGLDAASGTGSGCGERYKVQGLDTARYTGYRGWVRREVHGTVSRYGERYRVQGLDAARNTRYRVWIRQDIPVQGLDTARYTGYRGWIRREVQGLDTARGIGYRVWIRREIKDTWSGYGKIYRVQGLDTARSTRYRSGYRERHGVQDMARGTGSGYG